VDGDFIPDAPSKLIATGQFARKIPIIQGWNENDGSLFTPSSITDEVGVLGFLKALGPGLTNASLHTALQLYPVTDFVDSATRSAQWFRAAQLIRDIVFTCPALRFAEATAENGADAYLYNLNQTAFARRFAAATQQYLGVVHYSDIPYVFNLVSQVTPPDAPLASDITLAHELSGSWSTFAWTGRPCGKGKSTCQWPEAFSSTAYGVKATVEVIGGPDPGPKQLTSAGGIGAINRENLWARCDFVQRSQSELRV
jgi:carboxylesterase type B